MRRPSTQEPHPDDIKGIKEKWQSQPEHKDKIDRIVQFFGYNRGLDDATRRLHEAVQHVWQENGTQKEKEAQNDTLWPRPPAAVLDEIITAIDRAGNDRSKYVPPKMICKHMAYLLSEISAHHYEHDTDIVSTKAGSEILGGITQHVVVYDRNDDIYRDPTPYRKVCVDGTWKPTKESKIQLHHLTHKQAGVRLKRKQ